VVLLGLRRHCHVEPMLNEIEKRIAAPSGKKVYVDVSPAQQDAPAGSFYLRSGFA